MNFSIHQVTSIGNRKYNQDRVAYAYNNDALLMVLADGMGGHLHGELAAELAVGTFVESFGRFVESPQAEPQKFLEETMLHANQRILQLPHDKRHGGSPGTTCVAAMIRGGKVYWGHAGDSRLYVLRNGRVLTRTHDHSMVYQWLQWGLISAEEARIHPQRNQITNCLGGVENMFYIEPGEPVELQNDDVLLLGSDGLWGPFTDAELASVFVSNPVDVVLENLVVLAVRREKGRSDNVTGIAMRWGGSETAHDTAEPVSHVLEPH
ncbi:MAG: serine/threonine-protein phosphatase [Nitrosomonadales bacterium]|nr:serine/threonine-protein phosphatase [Nitrosomonadales bacterium]